MFFKIVDIFLVTIIVDLDRKNTPSCPIYKRKLSQQKLIYLD